MPNLFEKLLKGEKLSKVKNLTVSLYPDVEVDYSKDDLSKLNITLENRGGGFGRVEGRVNGNELTGNASDGETGE